LRIKGYGSTDCGYTRGSAQVKLTITKYTMQLKVHVVPNELQQESILIGRDVTECADLLAITKEGKWWFFEHTITNAEGLLPIIENEKFVLRAQCTTTIPPNSKALCYVYSDKNAQSP